jgi:hypothetical protein
MMVDGFVAAYRQYCLDINGIADLELAPFQILAGESEVYALKDHPWHLDTLALLRATDPTTFRDGEQWRPQIGVRGQVVSSSAGSVIGV